MQAALLLFLSACSASPSGGTARQAAGPPFAISEVATFNAPWAMDFLPGGQFALVTEKPGRIWWVDVSNGRKIAVSGVPKVILSSQGGLLDVAVSPTFRQDGTIYLTY
jgi:glucose/arabinose dehydrogenase